MSNTIAEPIPAPKKATPWKVIVPVIILVLVCCLFLVIAGIIAYIGTQGQGPAKFLATDTPTRTPTRTFTPTPEFVRVAIYDSDDSASVSYFSGGWGNDVDMWETILNSDTGYRFSVSPVTDLYASTLAGFSRLILPDNSIPDFYLADVEAWLKSGGHTIIAADSGITYISYSGLFWEDSEYSNGEDIYWDYDSESDDLSLVFSVKSPAISSPPVSSAANPAMPACTTTCSPRMPSSWRRVTPIHPWSTLPAGMSPGVGQFLSWVPSMNPKTTCTPSSAVLSSPPAASNPLWVSLKE